MQVKVHMTAFGRPGEVRLVEVPDSCRTAGDGELLGAVYHYGQNDFQPQPHPSLSVGDVIELPDGRLFVVRAVGFAPMTTEEFQAFAALPSADRALWGYFGGREV
jgi:hypothetical protein